MGRKHMIEAEDPILKRNHLIEKRKKEKLAQREKERLEAEKEKEKLQQRLRAKQQVMEEEQRLVEKKMERHQEKQQSTAFLKVLGVNRVVKQQQTLLRATNELPQFNIQFEEDLEQRVSPKQAYEKHWRPMDQAMLIKKAKQKIDDLTEKTKNDMRQLFGKEPIQKTKSDSIQFTEHYKPELLIKHNFSVRNSEYCCNELMKLNLQSSRLPASSLSLDYILSSYMDYIHIEAQQEKTISEFRQKCIQHALRHLQICEKQEKSKGFTNPKILILTPFMGDARSYLETLSTKIGLPEENSDKVEQVDDDSDMFRIGMTISKKNKKLKYFTNFNHSHIIVASPLGLRTITGVQGQSQRDFSFLSSIELLIIDRAHVILMQNWSHLLQVMAVLNKMPKYESMVNPIDRIRDTFLSERCRYYRQNIVFSQYSFGELSALCKNYFENHQGWLMDVRKYGPLALPSTFHQEILKVPVVKLIDDLEVRLDFFRRKVWQKASNDEMQQHYLIFTSNYFEFVKVKGLLERVNAQAGFISEHTKKSKIQSRISRFNNGQLRFIVLTERAYFYGICQIERIQNVLFYSIPRNNWIYQQIIGSLRHPKTKEPGASQMNSVISLCSRFEGQQLERIIGSEQAQEFLHDANKASSLII